MAATPLPFPSAPTLHVTVSPLAAQADGTETKLESAGKVMVAITLVAVWGPALIIVIV